MNHSVSWIFFDIGSTLVDESLAYDHRIQDMIAGTGLSFEEVCRQREALSREGYDGNSKLISHYGFQKTPWHSEDERLYSDTRDILRYLRSQGYRLGIIANQAPGTPDRLANWGILDFFRVIAASGELGVSKPDPDIFLKALALAGCAPSQAVMVGDRLDNDILPAKQLGFQTVWIRTGTAVFQPRFLADGWADGIVDSLAELKRIF